MKECVEDVHAKMLSLLDENTKGKCVAGLKDFTHGPLPQAMLTHAETQSIANALLTSLDIKTTEETLLLKGQRLFACVCISFLTEFCYGSANRNAIATSIGSSRSLFSNLYSIGVMAEIALDFQKVLKDEWLKGSPWTAFQGLKMGTFRPTPLGLVPMPRSNVSTLIRIDGNRPSAPKESDHPGFSAETDLTVRYYDTFINLVATSRDLSHSDFVKCCVEPFSQLTNERFFNQPPWNENETEDFQPFGETIENIQAEYMLRQKFGTEYDLLDQLYIDSLARFIKNNKRSPIAKTYMTELKRVVRREQNLE